MTNAHEVVLNHQSPSTDGVRAPSSAESLRQEIVASEGTRADYLRLKLIATAAIAAAALGLGGNGHTETAHRYLICLVPFACAFCDLLCAHTALRILVIGTFLRKKHCDEYESFVDEQRGSYVFALESFATWVSSGVLSAIVLLYPIFDREAFGMRQPGGIERLNAAGFYICGAFGIALSLATYISHKLLAKSIGKDKFHKQKGA